MQFTLNLKPLFQQFKKGIFMWRILMTLGLAGLAACGSAINNNPDGGGNPSPSPDQLLDKYTKDCTDIKDHMKSKYSSPFEPRPTNFYTCGVGVSSYDEVSTLFGCQPEVYFLKEEDKAYITYQQLVKPSEPTTCLIKGIWKFTGGDPTCTAVIETKDGENYSRIQNISQFRIGACNVFEKGLPPPIVKDPYPPM